MLSIGVMLNNLERDRLRAFQVAVDEGFRVVHTNALAESWLTGSMREEYIKAARASGLTISTMFIGFDGQDYSSLESIARTVGILPLADWEVNSHRIHIAFAYSDLARELKVPALAMHMGFIPKDKVTGGYTAMLMAVKLIADQCAANGQFLNLETGQDSASQLLEFIQFVDRPNVGVNFDPANFLIYDTNDPLHALDVLGPYVRGVHCKDAIRPTKPGEMGKDVPLGTGQVDFPRFLSRLKSLGYAGPFIIERESGPDVRAEIQAGKKYLETLQAAV